MNKISIKTNNIAMMTNSAFFCIFEPSYPKNVTKLFIFFLLIFQHIIGGQNNNQSSKVIIENLF